MAYGVHKVGVCDDEVSPPFGLWLECVLIPSSTLFWAGETFAPGCMVNPATGLPCDISPTEKPQNIQTFLQARFLAMYEQLVRATGGIPGVLGFEVSPRPRSVTVAWIADVKTR